MTRWQTIHNVATYMDNHTIRCLIIESLPPRWLIKLPYMPSKSRSTCQMLYNYKLTRGSAIAEEPCDVLRQLKYYGRFLTELLTRSSANPEEPYEHTVSWNRVKCCTNVRRIACKNVCNRWMTFKVIQGHCHCHHLIGHILFHISLPL